MRNKKTIIGIAIFAAILILGVGYASITGVNPSISGNAEVKEVDLDIEFTGTPSVDKTGAPTTTVVSATIENALSATIDVSQLERKGDTVVVTYTIRNNETDVAASIIEDSVVVTNDEFFKVTTDMGTAKVVQPGATTTVQVTVEVIKTPIDSQDDSTEITVNLVANPV